MYVVLLRFGENRDKAAEFMGGHNAWLQRGFEEGVFLLAGSLQPGLGGAILARAGTRDALMARVDEDPFVAEKVVDVEILEISPKRADGPLNFLLA